MDPAWTVKLNRAQEHLADLKAEVDDYLSEKPAWLEVRPGGSGVYELELAVRREPPQRWSTVIGDVLHNVRSALDARAYSIITSRATGELSNSEIGWLAFPITGDRASFEKKDRQRWHAGKAPGEVVREFAAVQPWADLEGIPGAHAAVKNHPLWQLQALSNVDKHRTLHPTLCAVNIMYAQLPEGAECEDWRIFPLPWKSGDIVARCVVSGLTDGQHVNFGDDFNVALSDDVRPLSAPPVVGRLEGIIGHAKQVLWRLDQS